MAGKRIDLTLLLWYDLYGSAITLKHAVEEAADIADLMMEIAHNNTTQRFDWIGSSMAVVFFTAGKVTFLAISLFGM